MKSKSVIAWIAIVVACSAVAHFDDGWLASWLSLQPRKVMHGELWRLVTWPLIESGVASVFYLAVTLVRRGDELAIRWGPARLFRFVAAFTLAGGIAYTLAGTAAGDATLWRCGGNATTYALCIGWARAFPNGHMFLLRMVTVRSLGIIGVMCALAAIETLVRGPIEALPELVACALAILWPQRTAYT